VTDWNFAEVWQVAAEVFPEREAVVQGACRRSWGEFDRRAGALAADLAGAGLGRQAKVAQYLYNSAEYLESVFAAFKARLVPVNTNYRYTEDELAYLWDNADVEAVIFHGSFTERVSGVRDRVAVKEWWWVEDGSSPCPEWARSYEEVTAGRADDWHPPIRSGDDLLFIYTGGTTGMPKGVMWRQDDVFAILNQTADVRYPEQRGLASVREFLGAPAKYPPARLLPGPPLMHGTGLFTAFSVLSSAGTIVMPESRHFRPEAILDLIQAERVTELSIVGDAFARPILEALDANPNRWDLSSLWMIVSSGVMWSAEVKAGLLKHNPGLVLVDLLGSSEAVGMARSKSRAGRTADTAGFQLSPDTRVIAEDGREVTPGSGEVGRMALKGRGPIGYYKDLEKTAATFVVLDGERYSIPGDFATVRADGSVQLLGRGSGCINTGGEKVFPEEVEEVLKLHPAVADAVVVGVPHERFGESVAGVVELRGEASPDDLIGWVRARLAAYKAPRHILVVDSIGRSPSGKVDYRRLKAEAASGLS
jgi:acyl-CoA synthetase (AMP-forming)/AMP-acid ligase II